ncbi:MULTISPECIES: hypothetical protein [Ramlibacter]|uniref:MSHA biogenesis protein MshK n=1 Tax=Ramlibacter aquaticus TaxID=2780094 RepID=A0ABR9SCW9_9BURK|nr:MULTISPECIES: hypothetical protein [Ramlibacter]MBE7940194.1 hypothetical protein [Ramlibacter aquaticus]
MFARRTRPADLPPQALGLRRGPAGPAARTRAALALAAFAWACGLPAHAAEAVPRDTPPAGAWQRVQRGPASAIALIHARDAVLAKAVQERPAQALPQAGFVADHGGIAWQLEGGGRITVRRQHGKPMLFFRREF